MPLTFQVEHTFDTPKSLRLKLKMMLSEKIGFLAGCQPFSNSMLNFLPSLHIFVRWCFWYERVESIFCAVFLFTGVYCEGPPLRWLFFESKRHPALAAASNDCYTVVTSQIPSKSGVFPNHLGRLHCCLTNHH